MEGGLVGFRKTGKIAKGTWLWQRLEQSKDSDRRFEKDAIMTKPARKKPALKQLLGRISPKNVHADVDWGKPKGKEAW